MNVVKIIISLVAVGLFGVAVAQDQTRVKIEVKTDDGDGEGVHIALDGDDLGINLHDMQEGENQAIVDEQGRTILITREADGFRFDVDGKTIKMPMLDGDGDGDGDTLMKIHSDHNAIVDVHVAHEVVEIDGEHGGEHTVKIVKKVEVVSE